MTDCDACREKRVHTAAEWAAHHEYARHGYTERVGWSHPKLEKAAKQRAGAASPARSNGDVLAP